MFAASHSVNARVPNVKAAAGCNIAARVAVRVGWRGNEGRFSGVGGVYING